MESYEESLKALENKLIEKGYYNCPNPECRAEYKDWFKMGFGLIHCKKCDAEWSWGDNKNWWKFDMI